MSIVECRIKEFYLFIHFYTGCRFLFNPGRWTRLGWIRPRLKRSTDGFLLLCLCVLVAEFIWFPGKIFPFRCTNSRSIAGDTSTGFLRLGSLLSIRCENLHKETVSPPICRWHPPWILRCYAFEICCTARLMRNNRICRVWPEGLWIVTGRDNSNCSGPFPGKPRSE